MESLTTEPSKARLKETLDNHKISVRAASRAIGRDSSYLAHWFGAKISRPLSDSQWERLRETFGLDVDYVRTGRRAPEVFLGPRDLAVVAAATVGGDAMASGEETVERPAVLAGVDNSFAIRIGDDRMRPRYRRNDVLYFHGGRVPEIDDCVALTRADGQRVVGILVARGPDGILLKSLNPEEYETHRGALGIAGEVGVLRG